MFNNDCQNVDDGEEIYWLTELKIKVPPNTKWVISEMFIQANLLD